MNRRTVHGEASCFFSGSKRAQPGGCVWCLLSGLGISVIEVLTTFPFAIVTLALGIGAVLLVCFCSLVDVDKALGFVFFGF